jgi:hypothetical protein
MKYNTFILASMLLTTFFVQAQESGKKGYNLGALPAVSFNTDEGFQYGAIVNLFNYGDGSRYPRYDQSYYLELSKYTKGSSVLRFYFDSDQLIEGLRTFADISYIDETMVDFYGFNGYKSRYSKSLEESNRAWYKISQKQARLLLDLKGNLGGSHFYWVGSFNLVNYKVAPVDYKKLNQNEDYEALSPGNSMYEKYTNWNLIKNEQADGGLVSALKAGFGYDSRAVLNNPDKGLCSEILLEWAPGFMNESPYARYSVLHRQYFNLVREKLNLAIRLGMQGKIGNRSVPFYRNNVLMSPFANRTNPTGLGGTNSLRGILRNRVTGDAFAFCNTELRWKAWKFRLLNQNFYLGINGFFDAGQVVDPINWNISNVSTQDLANYFSLNAEDGLHSSVGGGMKLAMNENFVISCEWGKSLDKRDGEKGMYINLNYLF